MPANEPDVAVEIIRALTPDQKLAAAHSLWLTAWELAAAGLRKRHPELTADQIRAQVGAMLRDRA